MSMVERVAKAISGAPFPSKASLRKAKLAIEAIPDDDEAFLAALSERIHDARLSQSGETYPVPRNFIRALKDAALNEGKEGE